MLECKVNLTGSSKFSEKHLAAQKWWSICMEMGSNLSIASKSRSN